MGSSSQFPPGGFPGVLQWEPGSCHTWRGSGAAPTLCQALQVQLSCCTLCAGGGVDRVRGGFRPWPRRRVIMPFASALCLAAAAALSP